MSFFRVLSLVAVLAMASVYSTQAQLGAMPGSPEMEGPGAPPVDPPPACKQLMVLRDETQKNGAAIGAAQKRKPDPVEVCKLFTAFLASEAKFIQGMTETETSATCGVPPQAIKNYQDLHDKAPAIGQRVCELAARRPVPGPPYVPYLVGPQDSTRGPAPPDPRL